LELRDRRPALHQSGKVNIVLNLKDISHIAAFFPDRALKRFDVLNFVEREHVRGSDR